MEVLPVHIFSFLSYYYLYSSLYISLGQSLFHFIFRALIAVVAKGKHGGDMSDAALFRSLFIAGFVAWLVLIMLDNGLWFLGARQHFQWGGVSAVLSELLYVGSAAVFFVTLQDRDPLEGFRWDWILMITMSVALFVDRSIVAPTYKQLYHFFRGKIGTCTYL